MVTPSNMSPGNSDDNMMRGLKPVTTKPKQPSHAVTVLPDSPYQPTSQSHVAALANSLLRRGSGDLALGKAGSTSVTPVLQDSPYQPSSHAHVAQLARTYAAQASSGSSDESRTQQHGPALADSGDFQPGSRSHVKQLISQVTSALQAQTNGSSSLAPQQHLPEDLPYQPDSKSHVAELAKTLKQTASGPAVNSSSSCKPGAMHGPTPHNTPLARNAVGTFFTKQQEQQVAPLELMTPMSQTLSSSSDAAAASAGPEIIHLSYGKAAPFKKMPSTSKVAALTHQLDKQHRNDSTSDNSAATSSAAAAEFPGTGACASSTCTSATCVGDHLHKHQQDGGVARISDVLATAATPAVSSDGMSTRMLPPSCKPQVVTARLSSITLEGAKVALERTASAEVAGSLASDSGQNMNPLYRPSSEGVDFAV